MAFGKLVATQVQGGTIFALTGDLGTGKTVLVRGIALGLGVPSEQISSPTFTLIQEYSGSIPIIHVDLYRLNGPTDTLSLGLHEYLNSRNLVLIEWPDRLSHGLPLDHMVITLEHGDTENARFLTLYATGPHHSSIATAIKATLREQGWLG